MFHEHLSKVHDFNIKIELYTTQTWNTSSPLFTCKNKMVAFSLQNNPLSTHSVNFYSTLWMLKKIQPALWRGSAWHINLSWLKFIFNESSFLAQLLASSGKASEKPNTWKYNISIEFLAFHTSACWSCILAHKVPKKGDCNE